MSYLQFPRTKMGTKETNNIMRLASIALLCLAMSHRAASAQSPDILIADFEGDNYGDWQVSGNAFGSQPARGAWPNQMVVKGFAGKGLANSFSGGDKSTGKLTSPTFKVARPYLQFLIGGGGWEHETCINLIIDGKVVRTATGQNTNTGGTEKLHPAQWDVAEFLGQEARLEIVDEATGGWGHINVDQIVQTDTPLKTAVVRENVTRKIVIDQPYLNFPVKNGAPKKWVTLQVDGKAAHRFDIELADGAPDWWAFMDATPFQGKTVTVQVDKLSEDSKALRAIDQTKAIKGAENLYHEHLRPQFHFTSRRGWLNDPNGLVYFQGEYHLFYQHNPYGWGWGNMHWGHAVSKDLVHWEELPIALYPDEQGTMFSGSAVVDWHNSAGFQTGSEPALILMYTAAGKPFTQGLAYSNDRGRTWVKYENNPVLNHLRADNRDPKVVWYAPGKKWVMSLFLDADDFAIFDSTDLKQWNKLSDFTLRGDRECPNFFELPLDDNRQHTRWIFFGANGVYETGRFDGTRFTPETSPRRMHNGNCWYAAQVFSDIPESDGRCILIPWGKVPNKKIFQGMPFNQMMGLPVELTLVSTDAGPTLKVQPVRELESLRAQAHSIKPQPLDAKSNPLAGIEGELFEITAEIEAGSAKEITFDLRGVRLTYDTAKQQLSCLGRQSDLLPTDGVIVLHLFIDRRSVDIFGAQGDLYMPMASAIAPANRQLKLSSTGGKASIRSLTVYELNSAW